MSLWFFKTYLVRLRLERLNGLDVYVCMYVHGSKHDRDGERDGVK